MDFEKFQVLERGYFQVCFAGWNKRRIIRDNESISIPTFYGKKYYAMTLTTKKIVIEEWYSAHKQFQPDLIPTNLLQPLYHIISTVNYFKILDYFYFVWSDILLKQTLTYTFIRTSTTVFQFIIHFILCVDFASPSASFSI